MNIPIVLMDMAKMPPLMENSIGERNYLLVRVSNFRSILGISALQVHLLVLRVFALNQAIAHSSECSVMRPVRHKA